MKKCNNKLSNNKIWTLKTESEIRTEFRLVLTQMVIPQLVLERASRQAKMPKQCSRMLLQKVV